MSYLKAAHKIEEASFSKIQEIIDQEHPDIHFSDPFEEAVLKRVVFTSADFDYLYNIKFSNQVIEKILYVLRNKGTIFTDTTMVLGGFNKKLLDDLGVSYRCLVNEPAVFQEAKEKGITRSMAAVEYAAKVDGPKLFVFGNAPTSIFKVLDMVEEGSMKPDAVVGFQSALSERQNPSLNCMKVLCLLLRHWVKRAAVPSQQRSSMLSSTSSSSTLQTMSVTVFQIKSRLRRKERANDG